ncbi:MAG: sugar transferase [Patescibacteria group bacterium]|nr:sugar transferase [Patescibacteria group bacterium]
MNKIAGSKRAIVLVLGDIIAYIFSLILTLTIRYGELPSRMLFADHIVPFSILFLVFITIMFSAGLYDKQSAFSRDRIQGLLFKAQIFNVLIGTAFFYIAPVSITPKANLAIFFVVSTLALMLWRGIMFPVLSVSRAQNAILIGSGEDVEDLYEEINTNYRYGFRFNSWIKPDLAGNINTQIAEALRDTKAGIIVADLHNDLVETVMPFLYSEVFKGKQVYDASRLYESIFDRIPLSMVGERWLVENASTAFGNKRVYDVIKRFMDIVLALMISIPLVVVLPIVYIAIKIEDGGPLFVNQKRIGKNGKMINIAKFRSMTGDDSGKYTNGRSALKVTRVGRFTRMTRIDELPQIWSVLKGDQSLIGPRPELPSLVEVYEKEIPYYNVRHLIKPGLSGWAQIFHKSHPHHGVDTSEARNKLCFDMFYIKHRSLALDLRIAMQTAKAILSKQGV